jgi:hypothetical protein
LVTQNLPKIILQRIASFQLQGKNGYEADLAQLLSHEPATLVKWSAPLTPQERIDRNNAIFKHWLAGETSTELARKSQLDRRLIDRIIKRGTSARIATLSLQQPPIYNVWKYGSCDPRFGQKHPGQIPGQAILNLLLWLTKPFDIVVDPMAGGGTTIDVC